MELMLWKHVKKEKKKHMRKERLNIYTTSSFDYLPSSRHKMTDPQPFQTLKMMPKEIARLG
jgi:hypothetical protein